MIRLCYTVATPECEDRAMLALRRPLPEAFALLASAGYQAAELMVRNPQRLSPGLIVRQAADVGLALPAVSTGQLRKEEGLELCALDEAARGRAVDALKRVVDFAAAAGAAVVNIGTLRGQLPAGELGEKAAGLALRSLEQALDHAEPQGVALAVEPQCRYVSNWINTVAEGLSLIGRFGGRKPRLVFDAYHALLEERSVLASLIRARPNVAWVQLSDNNRLAPGLGQQNFGEFIRVLGALGYEGFVSVECLQRPGEESAVRQAARHLIPFIEEFKS
jgi:sugar phosphate isomerase/epimerase